MDDKRKRSLTPNEMKYLKLAFSQYSRSLRGLFWFLFSTLVILDAFFLWVLPKLYQSQQGVFVLIFAGINALFIGLLVFIRRRIPNNPDPSQEVVTISGRFQIREFTIPGARHRLKTDIHLIGDHPVSLPVGWTDHLIEGHYVLAEGYPVSVKKFDQRFIGGPIHYFVLNLNHTHSIDRQVERGFLNLKNSAINMVLFLIFVTISATLGHLMYRDHGVYPTVAIYHYLTGNLMTDIVYGDVEALLRNPPPSGRNVEIRNANVFKFPVRYGTDHLFSLEESDRTRVDGLIGEIEARLALMNRLAKESFYDFKAPALREQLQPLENNPQLKKIYDYVDRAGLPSGRRTVNGIRKQVIENMLHIDDIKAQFLREEKDLFCKRIDRFFEEHFLKRDKIEVHGYILIRNVRDFGRLDFEHIIRSDLLDYLKNTLNPISVQGIFTRTRYGDGIVGYLDVENYEAVIYNIPLIVFVHISLALGILFLIRYRLVGRYNAELLKRVRGEKKMGQSSGGKFSLQPRRRLKK